MSSGDTTSADVTAVVKSAGEAGPSGTEKHSISTASELAVSSDEAGSPWTRLNGTTSANATAVTNPAGEARPPGLTQHPARTKPRTVRQLAETPEARAAWDRIFRMPDSAEKDALLEEFPGILQLCDDEF